MRLGPAALLAVLFAVPASAADPARLDVYRSDLRFAGDRGNLSLEADFLAAPGDDPATLRVTVGPTVVVDASRLSKRAKSRLNDWGDLRVRDPAHLRDGCRLRLEYRPTSGYLRMRLSGVDSAALRAAGPAAVPVLLEVSGRQVRASVTFGVHSSRRWAWRIGVHPRGGIGDPGIGDPGGGDPVPPQDPGSPPPPWPYGLRNIDNGPDSAILTATRATFRDAASFQAFWNLHSPGTPPPSVDFSKEMVFAFIAGSGYSSNRARIQLAVVGGVIQASGVPGPNQVGGPPASSPHYMVAVAISNMPVVWY